MNDLLYMLRYFSRNYFAWYTIILITSRDFAILHLYRCLRHFHTEHELRTIFHHFNFFKNDRKSQIAFFEKILQTKIFFLTHILYAKSIKNIDDKTHSNIALRFYSTINDFIIYVDVLESKLFRSIHNHLNHITWS
jgi:hypothetical protein